MRRAASPERQRDGAEALAGVVDGVDDHLAVSAAAVDDAGEALLRRARGGKKQRDGAVVCDERNPDLIGTGSVRIEPGHAQEVGARRHLRPENEPVAEKMTAPLPLGNCFTTVLQQLPGHMRIAVKPVHCSAPE